MNHGPALLTAWLVAAGASTAFAAPDPGAADRWAARRAAAGLSKAAVRDDVHAAALRRPPARTQVVDNDTKIDVNNISMFVTNTGSFAWDREAQGQPPGLEFPKGSNQFAVYAAGLWLGAQVGGQTRMAVSEYDDEYQPGAIVGSGAGATPDDPTRPAYKVYKLNRVYSDETVRDAELADYNAGAVPYGAPPVTVRPDGGLSIIGDQMLWAVYNDLNPGSHSNRAGGTLPLGIEVQQTTFAFSAQGALGNTIFIRYVFINKGPNQLDEMYVSQWSDPDLGDAADDLVGTDVARSIGFVYNATNSDAVYGSNVPAVGFDFFKGPTVAGTPLGMSSFNKYINGTDPNTAQKAYNYMKGLDADGNPVIDPTTNQVTTYVVNGDPVAGTGWLDDSPADRRLMLSSGPFSMAPGDTQEVVVGIVIGQSLNRTCSIALMKFLDNEAQSAFDVNFDVPRAPDPPAVVATPVENGVLLTWDDHAEAYAEPGYVFEGYAIYQGRSASAGADNWVHVATYDVVNGITTVLDDRFDNESCVPLPKIAARGRDTGLRYSVLLRQDVIRSEPLINAMPYYYTVRSYAVNPSLVPRVKESADTIRTVVPQTPPAGITLAPIGRSVTVTRGEVVPDSLPNTDSVQVTIVDPGSVRDASYRIGYRPDSTGIPVAYLVRYTAADTDTVLRSVPMVSGNAEFPAVDGLSVRLFGVEANHLSNVTYHDVGPNPPGFVGYEDLHMTYFDGSADYFVNIPLGGFTSLLQPDSTDAFHNVEIRFTGGAPGQNAYRYLRSASAPTYFVQEYVPVPFTVWDIDNNRQLNAGFLEMEAETPNRMWDPDTSSDPFVRREFMVVFASDYSPTAQAKYMSQLINLNASSDSLDLMYIFWPKQAADANGVPIPVDAGDKVRFQLRQPTANDFFTFSTRGGERSTSVARTEMLRIKAVPNPYFAHSVYELNQFNRVLKFTHLPERCTIRIFNLAGDPVRTLQKNDGTSLATWDLLTDRGLPIGSGIYVFHVEATGIGTHVGKVAVFMEKERLNVH